MPAVELSTNLLVELGGWPALKEARALVGQGRVTNARREGDVILASVRGAEKTYEPRITLAERVANVEVHCTCAESRRTGRVCAHALAAGLALLQPVPAAAVPATKRPARARTWQVADETTPSQRRVEITALLPLQLAEALKRDFVRII